MCGDHATQVDHVVNNDDHRPDNLAAICGPCHQSKTAAESALARRRPR
jgi:5-methylcytosine-specific restriction endonuclease McrA